MVRDNFEEEKEIERYAMRNITEFINSENKEGIKDVTLQLPQLSLSTSQASGLDQRNT